MSDIATMFWKEWRELVVGGPGGRRRGIYRMLFVVIVLAVLWPVQMGTAYASSGVGPLMAMYFAALFVMGMVPDAVAGERERNTLETLLSSRLPDRAIILGKTLAAVCYGWGIALLSLLIGLVVVNLANLDAAPLLYAPAVAGGAVILGLLFSLLVALIAVLVSLRAATVKHAQQVLTIGLMLLVFVPLFTWELVPRPLRETARQTLLARGPWGFILAASVALIVADAVLLVVTLMRFRRDRLMLES